MCLLSAILVSTVPAIHVLSQTSLHEAKLHFQKGTFENAGGKRHWGFILIYEYSWFLTYQNM